MDANKLLYFFSIRNQEPTKQSNKQIRIYKQLLLENILRKIKIYIVLKIAYITKKEKRKKSLVLNLKIKHMKAKKKNNKSNTKTQQHTRKTNQT